MHFVTSSARLQSTGTLYTTPIPYLTNKGDTDRPNAHKKPIHSITLYYTLLHPFRSGLNVEAQEAPPPTIEIISPLGYPAGSQSVPIQLKVSDSKGLHQVILFVRTREPSLAPAGFLEVKSCRELSSERDAIIEFDYDGVIPSAGFTRLWNLDEHPISIQAVDTEGNVRTEAFSLWEISPYHIVTLEHSPYSPTGLIPTVESVAYSPDGTMLASGAGDGTVKLWDMATKENIATFEGHTDRVSSVAFSPDGTTLVSGEEMESGCGMFRQGSISPPLREWARPRLLRFLPMEQHSRQEPRCGMFRQGSISPPLRGILVQSILLHFPPME